MVDGNLSMSPTATNVLLAGPADPTEGLLKVWKLKGLEKRDMKGTSADTWPMPLDQPNPPAAPHPRPEKPQLKPEEGGAVGVAVAVAGDGAGSLGMSPGGRSRVAAVGGGRVLLLLLLLLLLLEEGCELLGAVEPS
jgi:hypothetical protein